MIVSNLFLSILLFSGFNYIGKKFIEFFKLNIFFLKIVNLDLFNTLVGIIFCLLISYPLLLYKVISSSYLIIFLYIMILLGVYNFFLLKKNFYKKFTFKFYIKKNLNLTIFIFYLLVVLYFLISIAPITDADSSAYHLFIPKYFIESGYFPIQQFNYQTYLWGIGEILNLYAQVLDLEIFISLTNFLGLLTIISIIFKLSKKKKEVYFYGLLILSCPILLPLINTAKPQFLYISIISISFATLIHLLKVKYNTDTLKIIFLFICIFGIISYLAKVTFALSYFFTILLFFFLIFKNYNIRVLSILLFNFVLVNLIFVFPIFLWKFQNYQIEFIQLFINPIPNIPGIDLFIENGKNYFSNKSFFTYFFPLNFSDLTNTFGILILILPLLVYQKFTNKFFFVFIIISFIFLVLFFGQRSPRFFLEIYFLSTFLLVTTDINFKRIKFFKILVYIQSSILSLMIAFGIITLLPSQFNKKLEEKVFLNFSNGYQLYKWSNNIIPKHENFLTNHRSIFFSNGRPLFLEFTFFLENKNNKINKEIIYHHIKNIDQYDPNYILFWGNDWKSKTYNKVDFSNCIDFLVDKTDNAGFHASRNPFNSARTTYPAYIYKLKNDTNLDECVEVLN